MLMLHENMKLNRKRLKFTQQDIADMLNVDRSTYTAYETRRVPSLDILVKLCKLYRLTLDELTGVSDELPGKLTAREDDQFDFYGDLAIFDRYLTDDERRLLFSIRMLTNEQHDEVVGLIKKYAEENSTSEE